jgi:glucokinase
MECAVALDLGGTKLAAAVVDAEGRILARLKRPVDRAGTLAQIAAAAGEAVGAAGLEWSAVRAAGLIVPGIYFPETGNVWTPNLFGHEEVPLGRELAARLPVPVAIDSDRAGYVLGERWLGAARGLDDVVFLAVGTGIGAGIVTGGRLCRGAGDIAGAVGWFALDPRKRPAYKQTGCWETEAAGPAVARRAGMATAEEVAAAARRGEQAARRALDDTVPWLAMGIANLVSLLNPRMIVLGGGLMEGAGDLLLEPLRREVLDWAQPIAARQVRIELSELGAGAGLLGAARLAFDHVR